MPAVTVDIQEDLLQRAQDHAQACGFKSLSALVESLLTERLAQTPDLIAAREATRKFEELGYIDAGLDI